MTVIKRPTKPATASADKAIEAFMEGAAYGEKPAAKVEKEEGVQLTLRMTAEQLERLNRMAKRHGITRAAYMKQAIFLKLEADEQ